MLGEEGGEGGAIRVLKHNNKRGEGAREVDIGFANLEGELSDTKSMVGGVVTKKGLMAHFAGVGQGIANDSSGDCIDEQFAPLDIRIG